MFDSFYNSYKLTYNVAFAYEFTSTTLVYGLIALSVAYFFYIISALMKRSSKEKQQLSKRSFEAELNVDLNSSFHDMKSCLDSEKNVQGSRYTWERIFRVISFLACWYALFSIAIAPSILSGLGAISVGTGVFLTLLIFVFKYIGLVFWYCPAFLKKNRDSNETSRAYTFWRKVTITTKLYKVGFGLFMAFGLAYSIIVPLITQDTCMNFYNEGYGSVFEGFGISTRFSRYYQLDTVCPAGQICHLYATLPEDSSKSVILNVQTGTDVSSLIIGYDTADNYEQKKALANNATSQSYFVGLEERGARYVHSVYLGNLAANTEYYFEVYFNNKMQRNGTYRTLPTETLERDVLIAAGGDAGTTANARAMTSVLSNYSLDAILVGGDMAYDNGMRSCYYSIDLFLNMFEGVNKQLKRVVPLMFAIGNHDIGFNAFQDGPVDTTENLYYIYFPQQSKWGDNGQLVNQVPELKDRTSYYYHKLGNTVQLSLDSAYILKYDGVQEEFIKNVSKSNMNLVKMANFHVPMYPTCFDAKYDDPRTITDAVHYWAPLFEFYKFASVFENHVHLYKKTFPIKNNVAVDDGEGVIYFGDGNWGIHPNYCYQAGTNLNTSKLVETFSNVTHVWLINMSPETIAHYAVNQTNQIFDQYYNLTVKNYI
jgi:hypothetical protein